MNYWFEFAGKSSSAVGWLEEPLPIIRPEERVTHVEIPGRSGDLTILEDDAVYGAYIQTARLKVKGEAEAQRAAQWLRGSGTFRTSTQSGLLQDARIINSIKFTREARTIYAADVAFYCQPLKRRVLEPSVTITSGASLFNGGDVVEKPTFTVTGSGTISVTAGGNTLTVTGITSGCIIDCEAEMITNAAGTAILNANAVGSFPMLNVGTNTVTLSGGTAWTVTRKERFL